MNSALTTHSRGSNGKRSVNLNDWDGILSHFSPFFQRSVGFERMLRDINGDLTRSSNSSGYPPYNIIQKSDDRYVIEMALVGFAREDIELELNKGVLTVSGSKSAKETSENNESPEDATPKPQARYLHKGIANRDFTHSFRLEDHIIVSDAKLQEGLLSISLKRELPEALKPRRIAVG